MRSIDWQLGQKVFFQLCNLLYLPEKTVSINNVTFLSKMWSSEAYLKNDSSRLQEENFPVQAVVYLQTPKSPEEK